MAPRKKVVSSQTAAEILEAEQSALAVEAYLLKQQGWSWWDIAEELHLSEGSAKRLIANGMTKAAEMVGDVSKRMLLVLEVDRLDALMAAHWRAATEDVDRVDNHGNTVSEPPDVRAAEFVLKTILARAKLEGLEVAESTAAASTVVVSGNSEEYVAALKLISSQARPVLELEEADITEEADAG